MPTDEDEPGYGGDEEATPIQGPLAPRSGVALNLADVANATNEAVRDMQLASAEIDGLEGLARRARLAELGAHVVAVGGVLVTYGEALKEEAERLRNEDH